MADKLYDELVSLVFTCLGLDCPVLTGNMKAHISYGRMTPNETEIIVSGPSFDRKEYEKTGRFIFTGEYDYAASVNRLGAFGGKSTKSKHWVNKSLIKSCGIKAREYGAELIVNVEY